MEGRAAVRSVVAATVVLVTTFTTRGSAETPPAPFRLRFVAPAEGRCPNAASFLTAVHARTEHVISSSSNEPMTTVDVELVPTGDDAFRGRAVILEPDGARQERTVDGATCQEVAQALALIVALYLDPDAGSEPEAAPPSLAAPAPASPIEAAPAPTAEPSSLALAFGAALGGLGGVGPSFAPQARAFGQAELAYATGAWARATAWIGVDVAGAWADVGAGTQRYVLVAGEIAICPLRWPLASSLGLAPCAGLQIGLHRGASEGVVNERADDNLWLTPTVLSALTWDASRRISLRIDGGVLFPIVRTRFFLAPDSTLFRTPAVAGTAALALVVRLP